MAHLRHLSSRLADACVVYANDAEKLVHKMGRSKWQEPTRRGVASEGHRVLTLSRQNARHFTRCHGGSRCQVGALPLRPRKPVNSRLAPLQPSHLLQETNLVIRLAVEHVRRVEAVDAVCELDYLPQVTDGAVVLDLDVLRALDQLAL